MNSLLTQFRTFVCLSLRLFAVAVILFSGALAMADEPSHKKPAATPKKAVPKKAQKKLSGPELYEIHCNRCHPERYAPERTDAQWQTILLHMRTRANLPADQARSILKYLQEDSGK